MISTFEGTTFRLLLQLVRAFNFRSAEASGFRSLE